MAFLTQHLILEILVRSPAKSVGRFWRACKRWLSLTSRRQPPMPFLTDDLILQILIRSPAKSVWRFRCVCKRWLSLTPDTKFILAHASRAPNTGFFFGPSAVARHRFLGARTFSSPLACFSRQPAIKSSCNGLMLLCNQSLPSCVLKEGLSFCSPLSFALYNPTTAESWPISVPEEIQTNSLTLAFADPAQFPRFKTVSSGRDLLFRDSDVEAPLYKVRGIGYQNHSSDCIPESLVPVLSGTATLCGISLFV